MPEATSITRRVLDALVTTGLVTAEQVASVSDAASSSGRTPGEVLIERGLVTANDLTNVLEDELGIPVVDLSSYAPDDEAITLVPSEVARRYQMLPLFEIEGMLTVAVGDPVDVFKLDSVGSELGLEIEAVLAERDAVLAALADYYPASAEPEAEPGEESGAAGPDAGGDLPLPVEDVELDVADFFEAPLEESEPVVAEPVVAEPVVAEPLVSEPGGTQFAAVKHDEPVVVDAPSGLETVVQVAEAAPAAGPPAVDLDVLAVADAGKVALLVTEILEAAVARGASRIHILPYKSDFFVVFRIAGKLERIASAPLSMQAALVDGFKSFARLGAVPASLPALGRLKSRVGDKDLVVTVSSVPTVAGQRMVISIAPDKAAPRSLAELGISEAETKALHAMVERGRGILLVTAPVAGGRSSTYYALLSHAASVGKTVYSVERQIEYEIPAVAQVLVSPGSSVGAASYFAAGVRQDTDVMAIDAVQSVEEIDLAIEAAGIGKLVIATFSGGDIISGVHRMLDLGAEPVSLAAALTLGVGQRLVRLNCPNCSQETRSPLADAIPGAKKGMVTKAGTGCPNCRKTGFSGVTGIFEVLPFTESVRGRIARGASADEIAAAAKAAGMRSMAASGLSLVEMGLVSPEELNRVLRFAE